MGYQNLPAGVDPYAFTHSLQQLASQHQMQFINTTDAFTKPNDKFYVVDGHMNANGNAVVARVVVEHLLAEQMPALAPQGKALAGTSGASWKPAAYGSFLTRTP
jgi:hypothetical protein